MIRWYILLCLLAALTACNNARENRIDKLATAYCECTSEVGKLNEKIAGMVSDTAAEEAVSASLTQMQVEYNKAKDCMASVIGQYGKLNHAGLDSVLQQTVVKCPGTGGHRGMLKELLGE